MPISRHSQNVLHSPGHAASISIGSAHPAASRARVALIGNVTVFRELALTPERERIEACYIAQHPDARWWLPGPREPHIVSSFCCARGLGPSSADCVLPSSLFSRLQAYWARFDPQVGSMCVPQRCCADTLHSEHLLRRRFRKLALHWLRPPRSLSEDRPLPRLRRRREHAREPTRLGGVPVLVDPRRAAMQCTNIRLQIAVLRSSSSEYSCGRRHRDAHLRTSGTSRNSGSHRHNESVPLAGQCRVASAVEVLPSNSNCAQNLTGRTVYGRLHRAVWQATEADNTVI